MIFGRRDQKASWGLLEQGVQEALEFAQNHDLAAMEKGSHPIDGDRLFVNIVEYTTTSPENRFWEAHRDYLDVHVPIAGTEQIDMAFTSSMELEPYQKDGDFQPMQGEKTASLVMQPGDFLVCCPEDAHRTAVAAAGKPETVRKAIFKVRTGA